MPPAPGPHYEIKIPLRIDHGFVAGENTLEITVRNVVHWMGLYAELKGRARRF